MNSAKRTWALLLLTALLAAGCATVTDVKPGGGKTITAAGVTYDQLWLKVLPVITRSFDIKEIDKERGFIKATQGHWGVREYLYLYITKEADSADRFRVEVISTRTDRDFRRWDQEVVRSIQGQLERKSKVKDD
jgi:hypothetical protein